MKTKAVKNGIKISAKVAGVNGSLCIVAASGKATITPCS